MRLWYRYVLMSHLSPVKLRVEEVTRCPLCGESRFECVLEGPDHDTGTGVYRVMRCVACDMRFTSPRPLEEDLPLLYADRTFDRLPTGRSLSSWLRRARAEARIQSLDAWFPPGPLRVAEVGAGDGFFARVFAASSRCRSMVASDFFDDPPPLLADSHESGGARYQGYTRFSASDERFDLIFGRFVLEHVPDPVAFVQQLDARLDPGGVLILEVPNWNSLWRKIFRANFAELSLPAHLLHFTPSTLRLLLNGYETSVREDLHGLTLARSLGNVFGVKTPRVGAASAALFGVELLADRLVGPPANMTAIARKCIPRSRLSAS